MGLELERYRLFEKKKKKGGEARFISTRVVCQTDVTQPVVRNQMTWWCPFCLSAAD